MTFLPAANTNSNKVHKYYFNYRENLNFIAIFALKCIGSFFILYSSVAFKTRIYKLNYARIKMF